MSIEAMKQALEALGCIESPLQVWEINKLAGAMNALRQAIEFEEMVKKGTKAWAGTPDDWVDDLRGGAEKQTCQENRHVAKSATTEWVGLTDGEMQEAMEYWSDSLRSSYGGAESASEEYVDMVLTWRYIEAKLKEKNT
jgi:hypothetical protein